ncbi:hypothetical protein [Polaromonas sp. A23]|uniref:hypothetical protein n=1 Tax=Polaromonas sp. A23 TaxID=1944133 RepID=UPI0009C86811|nr:hypothetical protein [Polaromonas sp. A23]OOG42894.1 hypothetical protein B0B52_09540 [Polaromonas sp. A23]
MPIAVYVCYVLYAVYTGIYFYNRAHGKSAQFGVTRVFQDWSSESKKVADFCVGGVFLFISGVVIIKTLF